MLPSQPQSTPKNCQPYQSIPIKLKTVMVGTLGASKALKSRLTSVLSFSFFFFSSSFPPSLAPYPLIIPDVLAAF